VEAALHVGVIKGKAAIDQSIEVWRFDVPIAQSGNGIGALVVGEQKENIGLGKLRSLGQTGEQQANEQHGFFKHERLAGEVSPQCGDFALKKQRPRSIGQSDDLRGDDAQQRGQRIDGGGFATR
jgi:hypothetical protein